MLLISRSFNGIANSISFHCEIGIKNDYIMVALASYLLWFGSTDSHSITIELLGYFGFHQKLL